MRNKIITICSSASFFKEVLEIEKELKKLGFLVKVPKTAKVMQKAKNFDVFFHKTWYKNKNDYRKKGKLIKGHFKKIAESDAVLVLNYKKNNISGYIGANTLMEMAIAFHFKKPIFIYFFVKDDIKSKEEIFGLSPIFIKEDLNLIKKFL